MAALSQWPELFYLPLNPNCAICNLLFGTEFSALEPRAFDRCFEYLFRVTCSPRTTENDPPGPLALKKEEVQPGLGFSLS